MTEKFDSLVNELLTEAKRCNGPSLRQLSDKPEFRWMRCAANPYSPGYKRIYWGRRGEKINFKHCKRARPGSGKYEDCVDAKRALIRKIKRKYKNK